MIFINEDEDASQQRTDDHVIDVGRLHRVWDQDRQGFVPSNDIDSFAGEFLDDVLDPRATDTDAGTDAIDLVVVAGNGDLRTVAGFAGQRLDFDDPFGDFRNFTFEEPLDEIRMLS